MAAVIPTQSTTSPQKSDASTSAQSRYTRSYQPYVFQPNFLKQQMRQRELEKSTTRLSNVEEHTFRPTPIPAPSQTQIQAASQAALVSSLIEENNRKKSGRKVIDWTSSCVLYLERRRWQRDYVDVPSLLPDPSYSIEMQATMAYKDLAASSVATKFVRSATNKMKCPVYKVVWTPDGRRLVTGSASGEFTLWNGTAFNFETILQAHDCPVRAMAWSRNDAWLITGDNQGYIKYWQLNMNNVKMYQAHKDQACRSVCFGPTDNKFATASDDGTVRVWDFQRCVEEHILRGHGADVKQVDWHPQKGLIASASKDLQTPVKLWDPRAGQSLATIHAHKGTVMDIKWNRNGTWFLTASRDHLIKLYDVRYLKQEQQIFRGHKKEAFSVAWHPVHEDLFASGGSEGSILFWQIGEDKEVGGLEGAHDSLIWSLAWHPLGHILVSGSNDHSTKFWARNRPGEADREQRGNAFPTITPGELLAMKKTAGGNKDDSAATSDEPTMIPGMGDTDAAEADVAKREQERLQIGIPGLDWSHEDKNEFDRKILVQQQENNKKKIPYARPVPRSFVAAWESNRSGGRRNRSRSPSPHDGRRRRDDSRNNDRRNESSNIKQEFIPPQDGGNSRPPDPHAGPAPNNSQPPHPGQRTAAPHEAHHPGREMAVPQSQMGPPNPADLNSADAGSMGNPQHQENINNHTRFEHGPSRGDGNGPHNNFPPPHFHQPHPDGQQQPPMEGPHQQQQHGFPMNEMMQEGHNMPDQRMHPPEQMMHPPEQMMHPPDQTIHPPGHPMPPVEQRMHHPEQMMGPPPPEQGGLPPEQMMHPPEKMMHHPPLHGDGGPPGGFMPGPGPPPGGMEWEESEMYDMYGNPYDPSLGEDYADPNYLDEWGEPIYGEGLGMDGRFHHDGGDPNMAESGEWRRPPQKRGRGRGRGMPRGRGRGGAGMNHHGGEDRPPPLMDEDFSMRPRPRRGRAGARLRGADRMMGGRGRSRGRVRPLRGGARKRGGIRGMPPPLMEQ